MTAVTATGGRQPWARTFHLTLSLERGAVTAARYDVAAALVEFGFVPRTAFVDAVLLVVSELVTNAVQHAAGCSSFVDVRITAAPDELVITVEDEDPRIPAMSDKPVGGGLRVVTELAAEYGGTVTAERRATGKAMQVRLLPPGFAR